MAECDPLRSQSNERARLGGITPFTWDRSHRNRVAGIPAPPAIDVLGITKGTVTTGVKGVLPLP